MPVMLFVPYKLSAIQTAILMRFNSLATGSLVEDAHGYNIPSPYDPLHIAVTAENPQSGTKSLRFLGNAEAILTAATAPFTFTGDFTIEFFFWPNGALSVASLFSIGGIAGLSWQSQSLGLLPTGQVRYNAYSSASTGGSSSATTIASELTSVGSPVLMNQWNHAAIVRQGNTYSVYVNGGRAITLTSSLAPYAPTYNTVIGDYPNNSQTGFGSYQGFDGNFDNFRVTKGVARYSGATYTVPVTPFGKDTTTDPYWNSVSVLLDMETTDAVGAPLDAKGQASFYYVKSPKQTIVLESTINSAGTSGQVLRLDAGSSGLLANDNAQLHFGTGDFTVEVWLKCTNSVASYKSILSTRRHIFDTTTGFAIGINAQMLYVYADKFLIQGSTNMPLLSWNHIALVRKAGVFTLYLNGQPIGSYSASVYNFTDTRLGIGSNADYSENWIRSNAQAYMSEMRVSTTARYTAPFALPYQPMAAD